jgi:hypothetical protein
MPQHAPSASTTGGTPKLIRCHQCAQILDGHLRDGGHHRPRHAVVIVALKRVLVMRNHPADDVALIDDTNRSLALVANRNLPAIMLSH